MGQLRPLVLTDEQRKRPLPYSAARFILENLPITEEEIRDRSKGDELAKAFVIVQTTWFVVQCIARGVQRLTVTELEIVTLAYAALNGAMYFFWWDKPLDVQCPVVIPIPFEDYPDDPKELDDDDFMRLLLPAYQRSWDTGRRFRSDPPPPRSTMRNIFGLPRRVISNLLSQITEMSDSAF
ncbi:hypothetical protein H1R20_g7406, partial [Candolleomyces eurysporus]